MDGFTLVGRWIFLAGAALILVGGLLYLVGRTGIPLGRLPGDFRVESGGVTCLLPLGSALLLSLLLTLLLNVIVRLLGK